MNLNALLNPCSPCPRVRYGHHSESPTPGPRPGPVVPYTSVPKRQKIPKDAAIFSEGNKIVGYVNYPAHEAGDDTRLAAQHRRFQINPMGEIMKKGVRHIPYNSDKKDFMEKTGREAFEMLQYTFKIPGDEKVHVVVWDYNTGLVRMTPFFKALKYTKTVPAKALRENPGLKEISYSITGGALVCQGYWVPWQAARAISATFCYKIREALTPVFGNDFPSICLRESDPGYAKFLIAPDIVRQCTDETNRFRIEGEAYQIFPNTPKMPSEVQTPKLLFGYPAWDSEKPTQAREKILASEYGYSTESDTSDNMLFSTQVSPRSTTWTSMNRSQSPASPRIFSSPRARPQNICLPSLHQILPTSVPGGYYESSLRTKRTHSKIAYGSTETVHEISRPPTGATASSAESEAGTVDSEVGRYNREDYRAAKIMLQIRDAENALRPMKRTRRCSDY